MEPNLPNLVEIEHSQTKIGINFIHNLEQKGLTTRKTEFLQPGFAALGRTNEKGDPKLFEKMRNNHEPPDGYLIGVGFGNVLSMLEACPNPKAIILFDVDPEVVKLGSSYIDQLSHDSVQFKSYKRPDDNLYSTNGDAPGLDDVLKKHHDILVRLASEGNLVIAEANLINGTLIQEITQLPDFENLNNVIYLSNIADHVRGNVIQQTGRKDALPNFQILKLLQPHPPHHNFYVDTLRTGYAYSLRVSTKPPVYDSLDFRFSDHQMDFFDSFTPHVAPWWWQTRPIDEINGSPMENPIWSDIRDWDADHLTSSYQELRDSPFFKPRRERFEKESNSNNEYLLKHYFEHKKEADQLIPYYLDGDQKPSHFNQYVVPKTPTEETEYLNFLRQPYNYEAGVIPFLADYYWKDFQFPDQINYRNLPKKRNHYRDKDSQKLVYVHDWKNNLPGNLEYRILGRFIHYEELAMAKLYREAEKRLMLKKPDAITKGKTFDEIMTELGETT